MKRLTSWLLAVLLVCSTAFCASAEGFDGLEGLIEDPLPSDENPMMDEGTIDEIVADAALFGDPSALFPGDSSAGDLSAKPPGDSSVGDPSALFPGDSSAGDPSAQPPGDSSAGDPSAKSPGDSSAGGLSAQPPGDSSADDPVPETESIEDLFDEMETETESGLPDMMAMTEKTYPQLTAEDIVRLDGGDAEILYDDAGRATFIRGRYSPEKVTNPEEAAESLNYVSGLLGLTKGALLFCVYQGIDYTTGYTFYLFLQRDGDVSVLNASVKIYVDPDGYTAALSCSFNPATGIREETPGSISAEEAEQIVRDSFPDQNLTVYPGRTVRTGIMEEEKLQHVWAVFSDNPAVHSGNSDLPYLQHFVSYNGQYVMNLPCGTLETPLLQKDDALERKAKAMFEGYDSTAWTGDVTLHDGSTVSLTVPVARSREDGRYYLMDLDRMILVADYKEAVYGSGEYRISSSDTNSGWKDKELIALYNIARVYDYFNDHGYPSVDGCGIPLAILSGVCDQTGAAIDNAYFNGYWNGFGNFAISDINDTVECLDVMAHEFTHGITSYSMGGSSYVNDLGAINEAYSDIMGNLCELTYALNDLSISRGRTTGQFEITGTSPYGSTDDPNPKFPDWRIGEMGGRTYRDMSNPVRFLQPAFVEDAYYCEPASHSNNLGNDYGGVHENSSLLGSIAWEMNTHGLNYEKQYSLWMTAMNMMTPKSDYDDILQALIFARKTYGMEPEIDTWLSEAFAKRGMLEHSRSFSKTWDGMTFRQYHADTLKVLEPQQPDSSGTSDGLDSFLTGGTGQGRTPGSEPETAGTSDGLDSFLTGGTGQGSASGPEPETSGSADSPDSSLSVPEGDAVSDSMAGIIEIPVSGNATGITGENVTDAVTGSVSSPSLEGKAEKWLEGVGLDQEGRIAREGFGRIDFDIAPEDRDLLVGVNVLEAYTGYVIAVNCPDEEGHVSFLLPEGIYWLVLGVGRGGPNQIEFWPYTQGGSYRPQDYLTVFGEVEVKAGQKIELPLADVA